ncbi:head-tail adaptor protein [Bacillus pseudomycoides]|uniref:Head-tail adaptor protein n=1 Tax=Bacillus pseudomycoides TaxID=64104 RepID=A0A2B4NAW3_9BACI|nr:head-tail adaptor protein [Bacillus pseudomycoides]PEA84757.1 head-tail adaptor protein [Bacillus pseudomycoides]PED09068.1 head-tail adaptor protein [Bacillus pseudomycoides]PED70291.1 head-tail adaptor protein [Bacillus pseudomycoides]PEI40280.1 head-tail adaptor protein [Bacillus pseudomycoides]PEI97448.1 head-tail adaptor protein [Bacillus pseudomycoides]
MKPYNETFNEGFLRYGRTETKRSENGKRIKGIFSEEGKLAFRELSARDSDYQSCGLLNAKLDKKVKTLFPPSFRLVTKNKLKVVIDNLEYDVIKVDSDKQYLYFYLQEVGGYDEQ